MSPPTDPFTFGRYKYSGVLSDALSRLFMMLSWAAICKVS